MKQNTIQGSLRDSNKWSFLCLKQKTDYNCTTLRPSLTLNVLILPMESDLLLIQTHFKTKGVYNLEFTKKTNEWSVFFLRTEYSCLSIFCKLWRLTKSRIRKHFQRAIRNQKSETQSKLFFFKKKLFVLWHLCMYIVCYVNTLSDPVYRSNQTLKFFPVPRYKGHAFVLLAVVQKKIAITVTHTRLPLLNHQASVLHWKNLSGACLWQTVRAAVWGWLMWAVVEQSLW